VVPCAGLPAGFAAPFQQQTRQGYGFIRKANKPSALAMGYARRFRLTAMYLPLKPPGLHLALAQSILPLSALPLPLESSQGIREPRDERHGPRLGVPG
jgi:hypothetical protein